MTPTSLAACERDPSSSRVLSALVAGYVALLPYQFQVDPKINFAPADCLMVLVLVLAAGQLMYRQHAWTVWHFALAGAFLTSSLVAAIRFGTLEQYELLNKDAGLVLPFLSYAAITTAVVEWTDIRRILRVFTLSVVIENVAALCGFLASYFFGFANPFAQYGGLRLSGMLLDPNAYGGILAMALILLEGSSWGPQPLFRGLPFWVCRITLGLGLILTFSRSAWVALGLSLVVLALLKIRLAGRLMLTLAIVAPCLLLVMGTRFLPIFEQMASRPKQVQGRFDLIHDAYGNFVQHPFFGGGIGSFRLSEGEIAHNTAMWFLADFGVVGLIILLGFLGWFFVKGWFSYRLAPPSERPIALALLLAHTSMLGLAMGIEAFYQRHWWMVFGLIAAGYSLALRRIGANQPTRLVE